MNNPNAVANLKPAQPGEYRGGGRKLGSRNRKSIFQEWLSIETRAQGPGGEDLSLSQADQIAIKMIQKAKDGDVNAAYFVYDSAYGKIANKTEIDTPAKQAFDITKLSEVEKRTLVALYAKGATDHNGHIQEVEIITDAKPE